MDQKPNFADTQKPIPTNDSHDPVTSNAPGAIRAAVHPMTEPTGTRDIGHGNDPAGEADKR